MCIRNTRHKSFLRRFDGGVPARWSVAGVLALFLVACGDDGTDPTHDLLAPLVGTWVAESVVVTSAVGTADYIALGGGMRIIVESDGTVTNQTLEPGASEYDTTTGTVEVLSPSRLRLNLGDGPVLLDYTVSGDLLTFIGPGEIDVDDDGIDDPVTLDARMRRQ